MFNWFVAFWAISFSSPNFNVTNLVVLLFVITTSFRIMHFFPHVAVTWYIINMNLLITKKHDLIRLKIYFYLAKQVLKVLKSIFHIFHICTIIDCIFADSTYVSKLVLVPECSCNDILFTCQHSEKTFHTPHNVLCPMRHSSFSVSIENI